MASEVSIEVDIDEEALRNVPLLPEVQDDFRSRMERVEEIAKATAPVDTGEFRDKIHVVDQPDPDGTRHVDADADHSIYVEHGTRQVDRNGHSIHRPHYTLSHALDAAGGDH
jgi:hypothetical protein